MATTDRPRGGGNPLPIVIGVVSVVLVIQLVGAAVMAVSAREDSRSASLDIAHVVADSYAARGSTLARPARNTATDLAGRLASGAVPVEDPQAVADAAHGFLLAHPPFTSVTVAHDDSVVRLQRSQQGFVLSWGPVEAREQRALGPNLRPLDDASVPTPNAAALGWVPEALTQTGEPVWHHVEGAGPAAGEAVVSVNQPSPDGPYAVGVGVSPRALDDSLADGGDDAVATAFLVAADGTVIAGPEGEEPIQGVELSSVDGGDAGTVGDVVVFERSINDPELSGPGPNWTVRVQVTTSEIVPAVAAFPRTMLIYAIVMTVVVLLAALVLWRLRGPLGDMAVRARTDQLTGLANRHELELRGKGILDAALRRGAEVVVIVFDLDHFKAVNDRSGHDAGDLVLRACAHALELHTGPRDLVARQGGDEFVVVRWMLEFEDAAAVVEELRATTQHDIRALAPDVPDIGVSAGFASTATSRTYKIGELLLAADSALTEGRRDAKGSTYEAPATASAQK